MLCEVIYIIHGSILYVSKHGITATVNIDINNIDDIKGILDTYILSDISNPYIKYNKYTIQKKIWLAVESGKYIIYEFAGLRTW